MGGSETCKDCKCIALVLQTSSDSFDKDMTLKLRPITLIALVRPTKFTQDTCCICPCTYVRNSLPPWSDTCCISLCTYVRNSLSPIARPGPARPDPAQAASQIVSQPASPACPARPGPARPGPGLLGPDYPDVLGKACQIYPDALERPAKLWACPAARPASQPLGFS